MEIALVDSASSDRLVAVVDRRENGRQVGRG